MRLQQHFLVRRDVSLLTVLASTLPMIPVRVGPALADDSPSPCSTLQTLPKVLGKVNNKATGDPKDALNFLIEEPLLADDTSLAAALNSCGADDGAKTLVLKRYDSMREEFKFQTAKTYDARWADQDDVADLQGTITQVRAALERYLATVG